MSSSSPRATPRSPRGAASVDSSGSVQRSRSRILPRASSSSSSSSSSSNKGTMPKVYLISDVHFDGQNRAFIEHMPNKKDENSILVVAGDVGEKLDDVERCFRLCTKKFDTVFYSFGNHELWCTERDETCSYEKIKSVFEVCEKCGVKTNPSEEIPVENQGENARQAVFIAPVHSWYEQEFDTEDDVEAPDDVTIPKVEKVMTDYRLCKWPSLEEWKKEMTMEKISSNSSSARNTTAKTYSNDYYISRKIDALNDEDGKFERFLENVKRAKMEGKDAQWIEVFPTSILFRFMVGLSNKNRPVLPATNPVNARQRLFIIQTSSIYPFHCENFGGRNTCIYLGNKHLWYTRV